MKKFLTTTAIGGVLFLIPLVIIVLIIGKAFEIMTKVAKPLENLMPVDAVAGVGIISVMAIVIMLLVCVVAGVIARSKPAQALYHRIDGFLLEFIPGYAWTKTVIRSAADSEEVSEQFRPILVTLDDQMQVAFEMERADNGLVVVFFPGAPDVRSGSVAYVTPDRVTPIDTGLLAINRTMQHMGRGAAQLLPPHHRSPAPLQD